MTEYVPDRWVVLKLTPKTDEGVCHYRVFATWSGSYLSGNSWKLNSGIVQATRTEGAWSFLGDSGSTYLCRDGGYGLSGYGAGVLDNLVTSHSKDLDFQVLDQMENWNTIDWGNK